MSKLDAEDLAALDAAFPPPKRASAARDDVSAQRLGSSSTTAD